MVNIGISVILVLFIFFAACAPSPSPTSPSTPSTPAKTNIKIGVAMPFTGEVAFEGIVASGVELAINEANSQIAGRNIEIIKFDTGSGAELAVSGIKKLVELDKVDFIVAPAGTPQLVAIWDYVKSAGFPLLIPIAMPIDMPKPGAEMIYYTADNVYRAPALEYRLAGTFAQWLYQNKGTRNVYTLCMDNPPGYVMAAGFINGIKAAGGKVIKEAYAPMGTLDWAPFLADINPNNIDTLFCFFVPPTSVALVKTFADLGLKGKVLLTGYGPLAADPVVPMMAESGVGLLTTDGYYATVDNPINADFVKRFTAKYGQPPDGFAEAGYVAGKMILGALKFTGGDTAKAKLIEGLADVAKSPLDVPRGKITFDDKHNAKGNIYIAEIVKAGNEYKNAIVASSPEK